MSDVFVSYARVDAPFARQLCTVLAGHDREPWIDWQDIPPTAEWLQEIYSAIEASDHFVFIISPASCASDTCRLEVDHAIRNNKRLLPILHRDVNRKNVPKAIAKLNWVLYRETDEPELAQKALLQALDTDLDWLRSHTRLLVRSIEWEKGSRDKSLLLRGSDLEKALAWLTSGEGPMQPAPTKLQGEYVRESQEAESRELDRVRRLYERTLSSKLAAQAQWLEKTRPGALQLSMLLATESMRHSPTPEAEEILRRCLAIHPRRIARLSHDFAINVMAFSPSEDLLATASGELTERERYDREAAEKSSLEDFVSREELDQFLARGKQVTHDPARGIARLWDPLSGRELTQLANDGTVTELVFDAHGRRLATVTASGWGKIWKVDSGQEDDRVNAKQAVSAARSAERDRLQNQKRRLEQRLESRSRADLDQGAARLGIAIRSSWKKPDLVRAMVREVTKRAISISPDGRLFVDGHDGAFTVLDDLGREIVRVPPGGYIRAVAFASSGRFIGTAVEGEVEIWELEAQRTLRYLRSESDVGTLTFSADGSYLMATGDKNFEGIEPDTALWEVESGRSVEAPTSRELRQLLATADPWTVKSHDRKLVALRKDLSQTVTVRETQPGRRIVARLKHEGWPRCATFGPRGLLAIGTDLAAHVWEAGDGREVLSLPHSQQVRSVALDLDGGRLATACDDRYARVWDIAAKQEVVRVSHENCVGAVAFSPNGAYLATGGDDYSVRLWRVDSGQEVARLFLEHPVRAVAFRPDGKMVAAGALDGTVALWICIPHALIERACKRLPRDMTTEEWRQYLPEEPYRETRAAE